MPAGLQDDAFGDLRVALHGDTALQQDAAQHLIVVSNRMIEGEGYKVTEFQCGRLSQNSKRLVGHRWR